MKNVLLLLHDDEGQEARFQVALDLTKALSGHLICLDVVVPPAFLTDYFSDAGEVLAYAEAKQAEIDNVSTITRRLAAEDVQWSLAETIGQTEFAIARAAELADVIVVSARTRMASYKRARVIAEKLPLKARRPIMAVPPGARGLKVAGPAIVAWDGSDQASQALREAIPLLRLSSSVALLQVGRRDGENAIQDAAAYLRRHRIESQLFDLPNTGTITDTILTFAAARHTAYVVMGAYGVNRTLEAVVGGVTRAMLLRSEIPLFVMH